MSEIIKNLEMPAYGITTTVTNAKFVGDCKFCLTTQCSTCGNESSLAPTCEQIGHTAVMIARNDSNNPAYPIGFNYMWRFLNICFRQNSLEWEKNIRSQILSEEFQSKKIQKLMELQKEMEL